MDTTDLGVRASRTYHCPFVDKVVAHYRFLGDSLIHDSANAERGTKFKYPPICDGP